MKSTLLTPAALIGMSALAFAHSGVENPAVMARMHGMDTISSGMKQIGEMAKGQRPFDAEQARGAMREISRHAAQVPALFEAPETDPKSEALPAIWESYDDFTAKAKALEDLARAQAGSVATKDDLVTAAGQIAKTCNACHDRYRE